MRFFGNFAGGVFARRRFFCGCLDGGGSGFPALFPSPPNGGFWGEDCRGLSPNRMAAESKFPLSPAFCEARRIANFDVQDRACWEIPSKTRRASEKFFYAHDGECGENRPAIAGYGAYGLSRLPAAARLPRGRVALAFRKAFAILQGLFYFQSAVPVSQRQSTLSALRGPSAFLGVRRILGLVWETLTLPPHRRRLTRDGLNRGRVG